MLEPKFYKAHLERVSRSFAFCIDELKNDVQADVALAYLVFRVLDTIEDSTWENPHDQQKAFALFHSIVDGSWEKIPELTEILQNSEHKEEEAILVKDSQFLFEALYKLSPEKKTPFVKALKTMATGMEHFSLEKKHQLKSLQELDAYCYFVAGCIGELLTEWLMPTPSEQTLEESVHFGLFLQKINILKDFQDDANAGRNFLWSWQEVAATLLTHAEAAYSYIQKIPDNRKDYKIFCAWSFFLGLMSYPTLEKVLTTQKKEKISRIQAWQLLNKIKKNILAENDLDLIFREYKSKIPVASYKVNTKNLASI